MLLLTASANGHDGHHKQLQSHLSPRTRSCVKAEGGSLSAMIILIFGRKANPFRSCRWKKLRISKESLMSTRQLISLVEIVPNKSHIWCSEDIYWLRMRMKCLKMLERTTHTCRCAYCWIVSPCAGPVFSWPPCPNPPSKNASNDRQMSFSIFEKLDQFWIVRTAFR